MITGKATVKNEAGIHCRPTAIIIQTAATYEGTITVSSELGETTLKSALEIMMMGLGEGSEVTIQVEGPDEEETLQKYIDLFEFEFDFPPA